MKRCLLCTLAILITTVFIVTCSNSDSPVDPRDMEREYTLTPGETNSNEVDMMVLVDMAAYEYWAYANLLGMFSEDGNKQLFHESVDLGEQYSPEIFELYDRMYLVADTLRAFKPRLEIALASIQSKQQAVADARLQTRKLSDWFPPIFGWADKQPTETRNTIVGVMTTDPGTITEVYDLAKELNASGRLGDDKNVDLGATEQEFFAKLSSGALDGKISMHNLHKDAVSSLPASYGDTASNIKARPVDMVVKQGADGLAKGGTTYVDLFKDTVTGGLGKAGDFFDYSFTGAKNIVGALMGKEKKASDGVELTGGSAAGAVTARAADFASKKLAIPEVLGQQATKGVGKNLQDFTRNVKGASIKSSGGDPVSTAYDEDWDMGSISFSGIPDISGALISWYDSASGYVKTMLSPGAFGSGDELLLPAGIVASILGFGPGMALSPEVEGVTVPTEGTTAVTVPDPVDPDNPAPDGDTDTETGCDEYEFACNDGSCIPAAFVCDDENDCPGGEDEYGCAVDGDMDNDTVDTDDTIDGSCGGTCDVIYYEDFCVDAYDICRCNAAYGQYERVNCDAYCYDRNMSSSEGCYVSDNGSDYCLCVAK